MGSFKFTNFKTGKVYDSNKTKAYFTDADCDGRKTERQPIKTNTKDIWIDDPELADVLECEVKDISKTLTNIMSGK